VLPWVEEARKCDGGSESDAQIGHCKDTRGYCYIDASARNDQLNVPGASGLGGS